MFSSNLTSAPASRFTTFWFTTTIKLLMVLEPYGTTGHWCSSHSNPSRSRSYIDGEIRRHNIGRIKLNIRHCGLVESTRSWDGTGCEFESPRSERGFWYRRPLHPSEPLGGDIRHRWRCIGMDTIVPDWSNPTVLLSGLVVKDRETRIRRSSGLGAWPSPVPPLDLGSIPA